MIEGPVVNGRFDIIRASKCQGHIIKLLDKLSKTRAV